MQSAIDFRSMSELELLERANRILRGQQTEQQEIYRLARVLKNRWKRFGRARQLLWLARSDSETVTSRNHDPRFSTKLRQQHALCTYKDNDLPADTRFERALHILDQNDDLVASTDQETLGLVGGLFKAKWEMFGQVQDLQRSLLYYGIGWTRGAYDDGYTGVNTAYLLDLIAYQEDLQALKSGISTEPGTASRRRESAREIRNKLVDVLPGIVVAVEKQIASENDPDNRENALDRLYWIYVTLAEAYLGLGLSGQTDLLAGKDYLTRAAGLDRYDWMVESTARQLVSLSRMLSPDQQDGKPRAQVWDYMDALLEGQADGVRTAFIGKVGLALSGGGFRASLFHIGVLARLAEMDVLRHVEYLSCVSGGSIIGTYYYLEVRELLQRKNDLDINRNDYIQIVQNIEREFLAGIQQNIRVRTLTSFTTNFRHDPTTGILPTERTADLYDELLYSRIKHKRPAPKHMDELIMMPGTDAPSNTGASREFRPKDENWRRRNKIPILVLNCTTLNTGHNWQFTASWMGEPPATINDEIDANKRLRRMYYRDAPKPHDKMPIKKAVAASASVPGLFAPLALSGLYPDMLVRLADGGVHDNQGVGSLLEQGCTVMLVSDASGQLADESDPSKSLPLIAFRADDICQERVRVAEYQDLESRLRSSLLRSLMFLHLKKGLDSDPLDWVGCEEPVDASDEARPATEKGVLTPYGIHKKVQALLAAVRTDLDSFHDAEAYALMTSGYKMTDTCFPKNLQEAKAADDFRAEWHFLRIEPEITKGDSPLLKLLALSNQRLFKVWELIPLLRAVRLAMIVILGLSAVGVLVWLFLPPSRALLTVRSEWLAKTLIGFVLVWLLGRGIAWFIDPRAELRKLLLRVGISLTTAWAAWIHLRFFDPLYLKQGKLKNILSSKQTQAS